MFAQSYERLDQITDALMHGSDEDTAIIEKLMGLRCEDMRELVIFWVQNQEPLQSVILMIKSSSYTESLFMELIEEYGNGITRKIREIGDAVAETIDTDVDEEWDKDKLHSMSTMYWNEIIKYFISRGDYRRAWDEIRRSYLGFDREKRIPLSAAEINACACEPQGTFALDATEVKQHVNMLFKEIRRTDPALSDIFVPMDDSFIRKFNGDTSARRVRMPGMVFAQVFWKMPNRTGWSIALAAVILAKYFAVKRDVKRAAKKRK